MKHISIKELLQWRQAQAEADAPPAPRSEQLLAMSTDWWETWPEEFQKLAARLGGMAATKEQMCVDTSPVPTLLAVKDEEKEASADVSSFGVRNGWLRLRFKLRGAEMPASNDLEVTFVSDDLAPLFATALILNAGHEHQIEAELNDKLLAAWAGLKITDRMPFRFIIRAED